MNQLQVANIKVTSVLISTDQEQRFDVKAVVENVEIYLAYLTANELKSLIQGLELAKHYMK
jgi:hypothetical protein